MMSDFLKLVLLALLCLPVASSAQNDIATFEIAGLEVKGCDQTNAGIIKQISGLMIGDKIQVPGASIPNAIRKLLGQDLFDDVDVEQVRQKEDLIWLEIKVNEAPQVGELKVSGLKKTKLNQWESWLRQTCPPATAWLPSKEQQLKAALALQLDQQGYTSSAASIFIQKTDNTRKVNILLQFTETKQQKLAQIHWQGVNVFSTSKLERLLGKKRLNKPVFSQQWQEEAKAIVLAQYESKGYVDAHIVTERKEKINNHWHWYLTIHEGEQYTFGEISWHGAERFDTMILKAVLDIKTGDPYSPELLNRKLNFDPENGDISGLYLDRGHLFFRAEAITTSLNDHAFDVEIRLIEGLVATIREVKIEGNDRTNEHVIRRELRTQPGQLFSREEVLRSQRALINLGYFNPEKLGVRTDVDPESGTVDIVYEVEEDRNDKFELAGSFNPGSSDGKAGLVGTLGFTFNNFSLQELLKGNWKNAHGDGQQLSIRAQSSGRSFQAYNLSFQEPWFRGRPQTLGFSLFHQRFASEDSLGWNNTLSVSGASLNWGRRLPWGNGGWTLTSELGYQNIRLQNYLSISLDDGRELSTGRFNNTYGKVKLAYHNLDNQFFPHKGRTMQISGQWTPPWNSTYNEEGLETFEQLSYHKYRMDVQQFLPLGKKLVLRMALKTGALLSYDQNQGLSPFERFELGGNGMTGSQQASFVGNDLLSLRGYDPSEIAGSDGGGGAAFLKVTTELRYPLLNTKTVKGYLLGFAEAGNAWKQVGDYNPFELKRSVGLGIRLQLPMIGMIGFDYGVGIDKDNYSLKNWKDAGSFNLIFGWEPE